MSDANRLREIARQLQPRGARTRTLTPGVARDIG